MASAMSSDRLRKFLLCVSIAWTQYKPLDHASVTFAKDESVLSTRLKVNFVLQVGEPAWL